MHSATATEPQLKDGQGQLLLAQAVFRHGARSTLSYMYYPDEAYSNCDDDYPGPQLQLVDEWGGSEAPSILDLDNPKLPGGCRMGQLTRQGYQMAQDLGAWLRRRYTLEVPLLSRKHTEGEVALRSTCIHRAVQTLQGVAAQLLPDARQLRVNASSTEEYEFEYGKNTSCKALGPIFQDMARHAAARDVQDPALPRDAAEISRALGLTLGANGGGMPNITWVRLYDALSCMAAAGNDVPTGATTRVMNIIERRAMLSESAIIAPTPWHGLNLSQELCQKVVRLSVGPLIWRLVKNMEAAAAAAQGTAVPSGASNNAANATIPRRAAAGGSPTRQLMHADSAAEQHPHQLLHGLHALSRKLAGRWPGSSHQPIPSSGSSSTADHVHTSGQRVLQEQKPSARLPRMYLYSGHDSTITPLLAALGTPEVSWPPFTANLVFELWQSPQETGKQLEVRVLYNRQPLAVAGSRPGGWLLLSDLREQLLSFTASDDDKHEQCWA